MPAPVRLACLLCAALGLSACAPILAVMGTNVTLAQAVANVEKVKLAGDGMSFAASQKTITDHALSYAMGKDCKMFNVLAKKSVCTDTPIVAIDTKGMPKADTSEQIAALDTTIKTAAAGEPEPGNVRSAELNAAAKAGMQPTTDTPGSIAALGSNIRKAAVSAQKTDTERAAEPPAKNQEELAAIPGTNLKRRADPSPAPPAQKPNESAQAVASAPPAQTTPATPAHDEINVVQSQAIARPAVRALDVSRESGAGD